MRISSCLLLVSLSFLVAAEAAGRAAAEAGAGERDCGLNPRELLFYCDEAGDRRPVRTIAQWERRRAAVLRNFQRVAGPLPDASRKVPLHVQVISEERSEKFVRRKITFASEQGDRVPAYLLLPLQAASAGGDTNGKSRDRRRPAVLCLHQTTRIGKGSPAGLGDSKNLHYAAELAARGYVTLAPDYPNFGEHPFATYERGYESGTMKAIWDNIRAVDLLQSLEEVDPERIGCIGHSLGGHNTLFTATFEPRIKAVVTNCGFNAFHHYYEGDLTGWTSETYMPKIRTEYGKDPDRVPFDFYEIVAALAPRPCLVIAPLGDANFEVTGVKKVIRAAGEVYALYDARERLHAEHPDCAHDFPPEMREVAYGWFDRWLGGAKGE